MTEEWRVIPSFPCYEASSNGRARRTVGGRGAVTGKILSQHLDPRGRPRVYLSRGRRSSQINKQAHVLIAEAFIGPRPQGLEVNHVDGDKRNNRAANLEYVTPKENHAHAVRLGLMPTGERNGRARLTVDAVRQIRTRHAAGEQGTALAQEFGVSDTSIRHCVRRVTWSRVT